MLHTLTWPSSVPFHCIFESLSLQNGALALSYKCPLHKLLLTFYCQNVPIYKMPLQKWDHPWDATNTHQPLEPGAFMLPFVIFVFLHFSYIFLALYFCIVHIRLTQSLIWRPSPLSVALKWKCFCFLNSWNFAEQLGALLPATHSSI